jgi:NitT/TauT family transport system substrate-binding protein
MIAALSMRPARAIALVGALLCGVAGARAEAVKVRVAYVPVVGAAPMFVLDGAGWAREAGLDIALTKFESGPPAISGLASGAIDALAIGLAPIAVARAKGLDVTVVSAMANGGSAFVATPGLQQSFVAAAGDPARAFADFRARNGRPAKLATTPPGGVPNVALNHWLFRLNAVTRADVQIVPLGIDAIQQAILTGAVDGATVLEPALTIALERDPRLKALTTAGEMFKDVPGVALAVSGAFAKAHPEAVDKLVSLVARASDAIVADPAAAALVQPILGGGLVDKNIIARALASNATSFVADPRVIGEPARRMFDYQVEIGDFEKAPPTDGLIDTSVFTRVVGR